MVVRVDNEIMWEAQIEERHRNHERYVFETECGQGEITEICQYSE